MERRHLINGGLLSGLAGLTPAVATAGGQRTDDDGIAQALQRLNATVERLGDVSPELVRIREQQRTFLKANQKFPDFIEVGIGVWERMQDWHVRHQQPLAISRTAEGRYTMTVLLTTLVLRPDQSDSFIGFGFDGR